MLHSRVSGRSMPPSRLKPEFVLFAGDIFHTVRPTNPAILHAFEQFARLRAALPESTIVMVAGNHDTPRAAETGCILRLFAPLGIHVVDSTARRLAFPEQGVSILAVPDVLADRPALTPDPDARYNVLLLHGEVEGMVPAAAAAADRSAMEVTKEDLGVERWSYVALGHFHVFRSIAPNAFYSGSLDYTSANPWGELIEERATGVSGKGFIEYDLVTRRHRFHPIAPPRLLVDLPVLSARGLTASDVDAQIAGAVDRCDGRDRGQDRTTGGARHSAPHRSRARSPALAGVSPARPALPARRTSPRSDSAARTRCSRAPTVARGYRPGQAAGPSARGGHRPICAGRSRIAIPRGGRSRERRRRGVRRGGGGGVRLNSLHLVNFRQHADSRISFDSGLTGIIGPNGSGKTTILEAVAWALYGNSAARGTRESLRYNRAASRATVRVELDFDLAGHRYRVVRGLTNAELYLDGAAAPIANSITGVTDLLQRRLGMTRAEFFNTYFTAQKELNVMAAMGPSDRAKFLSRVLGYEKLRTAQDLVRDQRKLITAETAGLRAGMPDRETIERIRGGGRGPMDARPIGGWPTRSSESVRQKWRWRRWRPNGSTCSVSVTACRNC